MVDEKRYVDVISIYSDIRTYQIRESKQLKKAEQKAGIKRSIKNNEEIIRRPAGDNWF
jgi:hypothetical protein